MVCDLAHQFSKDQTTDSARLVYVVRLTHEPVTACLLTELSEYLAKFAGSSLNSKFLQYAPILPG
jgi:hypothetical protein